MNRGTDENLRASLTRDDSLRRRIDSLRRSFSTIAVSRRRSSTSNDRVRRSSHKEKDSDDDDDGYHPGYDDHNLKKRPSPHQKASLATRSNRRASNLAADTLTNRIDDFSILQDEEFERKLLMKIKEKQQQKKKKKQRSRHHSTNTGTPQEVQPEEATEQMMITAEDAKAILKLLYKPTSQRRFAEPQEVILNSYKEKSKERPHRRDDCNHQNIEEVQEDATHQHKQTHQEQPNHEPQVEHKGYRPDYHVGDPLRSPTHAIVDQTSQCDASIKALTPHDYAFIKRSNGTYSYAIIVSRSKHGRNNEPTTSAIGQEEEEEFLLFVMNKEGAIKKIHRRHWCQLIRLVDTTVP